MGNILYNKGLKKYLISIAILYLTLNPITTLAITYKEYAKLPPNKKQRLIRKYVKKKGRWWVVSTRSYIVNSNVSPEVTLRFAIFMSDFYKKFTSLFKGKFKKTEKPKLFIIPKANFRKFLKEEFDYQAPENIGGVYIAGKGVLAVPYESGSQSRVIETIQHEGAHQLLHYYTGKIYLPLWFNEGSATNFEEWNIYDSAKDNISRPPEEYYYFKVLKLDAKNGRLIPFITLFNLKSSDWVKHGHLDPTKYAQSWFTVNFLFRTKQGRKFFNKILIALRSGDNIDKIFTPKLQKNLAKALDKELRKLLKIPPNKRIYTRKK